MPLIAHFMFAFEDMGCINQGVLGVGWENRWPGLTVKTAFLDSILRKVTLETADNDVEIRLCNIDRHATTVYA